MLISYKCLNEYLDFSNITFERLIKDLPLIGIEVENFKKIDYVFGEKIVFGEIKYIIKHKLIKNLFICYIDIGKKENIKIVCNDINIKKNMKVIVALPGAKLFNNKIINIMKIHKIFSFGMICSLNDLGYFKDSISFKYKNNIYYSYNKKIINGDMIFKYFEVNDYIIDISVTPNRLDILNIYSLIYEISTLYNLKIKLNNFFINKIKIFNNNNNIKYNFLLKFYDKVNKNIINNYQYYIIENIENIESPFWLQSRLMNLGIKPVNNIIDSLNYINLFFGHVFYLFNFNDFKDNKIFIRKPFKKESIMLFDYKYFLDEKNDFLFTNFDNNLKFLCGISNNYNNIFLNKCNKIIVLFVWFNIKFSILYKRLKKINFLFNNIRLNIDYDNLNLIKEKFLNMLLKNTNGLLKYKSKDIIFNVKKNIIKVSLIKIYKYFGMKLEIKKINKIFKFLKFKYIFKNNEYYIFIPFRRYDIKKDVDIIEEIIRFFGFDKLEYNYNYKKKFYKKKINQNIDFNYRKIKSFLENHGFNEIINCSFVSKKLALNFLFEKKEIVYLKNPLNLKKPILRTNLISGLFETCIYNIKRKNFNVSFYEIGKIFFYNKNNNICENIYFSFILNNLEVEYWNNKNKKIIDFYYIKGILEMLFKILGFNINNIFFKSVSFIKQMHIGQTALIYFKDKKIGFIGQISPNFIERKIEKNNKFFVVEINLSYLLKFNKININYKKISKFPVVIRDISMLVEKNINYIDILKFIFSNNIEFLNDIFLKDIFYYKNNELKKSLTFRLKFISNYYTLTDKHINKVLEFLIKKLIEKFKIIIR